MTSTEKEKLLRWIAAMIGRESDLADSYFKKKSFEASSFHYARATAFLQCQIVVDKELKND